MASKTRRDYRRATLACFAATALVAPAAAWGGGFATVGVAPPAANVTPGKTWDAVLMIRQHGITPLVGTKPSITITRTTGGGERTFAATPTGTPGEYRARVVFPAAGSWTYVVDDGFSMRHRFPAVEVGGSGTTDRAAAPAADEGPDVWLALGAAIAAGLLAGSLTLLAGRRRATGTPATAGR